MNKKKILLSISLTILIISIISITYAFYLASATNTTSVVGISSSASLELSVSKVSTLADKGLVPMNDTDLQLGVTGTNSKQCIDINGNTVCQIYKITLKNSSTSSLTVEGKLTLTAPNLTDLKWSRLSSSIKVSTPATYSTKNIKLFTSNELYNPGATKEYYVVIWLSDTGLDQNTTNTGSFSGSITFTTGDGSGITASFSSFNDTVSDLDGQTSGDGGVYAVSHDAVPANASATGSVIPATVDYRYYGANPNNYIWFNCSATDTSGIAYGKPNYTYNTTNCELWRIIGSFKVETPIYANDGTTVTGYITENRVKIIRNDSIGYFSWDNKVYRDNPTYYYGQNDWTTARLMKTLNPGYENNNEDEDGTLENNSLYWNRSSGTCYTGAGAEYKSALKLTCNFTSNGLKNEAKNLIDYVRYYLGGQDNNSYTDYFYNRQVSNNKWRGNTSTYWNGYTGLMYADDYGYAAGESCAINTSTRKVSTNGDKNDYRTCASTNWLYNKVRQWTLSTSSSASFFVTIIGEYGDFWHNSHNPTVSSSLNVRPTFYLKSSVVKLQGIGTSTDPYVVTN